MIEFAAQQVESRLNALAQEMVRCEGSADPDTVHDLRIATRRLGGCLEVFEQFYPKRLRKQRKRLELVRKLAGPIRDLDVTLELLLSAGVPIESSLAQTLMDRRSQQAGELQGCINKWRPVTPDLLRAEMQDRRPKKSRARKSGKTKHRLRLDGSQSPQDNAAVVLPGLAKRFFRAGSKAQASNADPKDLHRFRIRLKRFRYTLELFRPCYEDGLSKRLTQLQALQDHLGRMNDCQTALDLVVDKQWAKSHPNAAGALRDSILTLKAAEIQEFQKCWREQFGSQERHRWIGYLRSPQKKRHLAA
jgi:CHAD domain-containing protein